MNKLRRFLTIGVMAITVLATIGAYAPVNASASAGDLIKMDGLSSVYYLGSDGKRYVFPNTDTYMSWYNDFSGVVTIPASELQSYPLGGNVTMRPGTKLVKITTDPSVYAVEPNGVLRKIQSEAQAAALYGTNWNKRVVDVADAFFTNYTISSALPSGSVPAGSLVKSASAATVYYFDGSNYRAIADESAFNANRFQFANIITVSSIATTGSAVSSAEFVNVAQNGATTGVVVTGSGLMVSLNSATPAAVSVPENGSRVNMVKVNLTAASDGAVTLNSLTVKRIGLSQASQIDKVWAEQNGVIVASKKSMNSNDESILTFSPALTINAGQTATLDLLVSFTTASGNIGLSIASASAVSATAASVTGSFPINGNLMSPTNYSVTNLSFATSSAATSVKVGDEKAELAHFTVAFKTNARDTYLKSITLKNNGVEDLTKSTMNLYLEYAGNKVSSSYTIDGRYVTFYFPANYELLKDDSSKDFYVKGDIIAKENTGTPSYSLVLNKSTDLSASEKTTGFGVNVVTTAGATADNFAVSNVNITSGAISVSKKAASASDTTIVKGSDNIVLLANVRADEAITVDGLILQYHSNGFATTTDQFENVRVYVNGLLLDSFDPSVSTTTALTESIDSTFTLNKGDNEVKVMVKAKTTATNGIFVAKLVGGKTNATDMFYGMNPEYVVSGNTVSGEIGGSATGATFTVAGASLTTVRNDGYGVNKTIVQGSTDISLGKFTIKANNDKVKVTSIAFGQNLGTTSASSISDMKLFVDGTQVGNTADFGTSGVTFSSLNFEIAKDSTKAIELKGSFDSSADGTFESLMTVNATDSRGTTITSGTRTATTTRFAVTSAGSLDVAVGGDTPVAGLLATKAGVEQEVAQFKFTAVNDSANLTEINVINTDGSAATSSADARIAAIKLYDGAELIDSFVPVDGAGKFTITNNKVVVAANGNKTLSIKVVLNNIDNDVNATNKPLTIKVTDVKSKSSAGAESTTNANATAKSFLIRKTVPTIAYQTLDNKVLTAGDTSIAKFTVTADSNGDVEVGKLVMTVSTTTSATISTSTTPLKVNGTNKSGATASLSGTKMTITFDKEIVAAGTSKTFEVVAAVSASAANQSVTARLLEDASYDADSTVGGVTGDFVWSDVSSVTTESWNSGHTVKGLPTTTWVLSN